ncbi:MAG: HIT family protein [Gammaproteobacteria bacterium]|jgi:ATP adenylyltransferase|nr:HIT family protein [Gammaproteobacteria bacterium]
MSDSCVFCNLPPERVIDEDENFFVIRDGFPVTELHSLIISKRHTPSYFDLTSQEIESMNTFLASQRHAIVQIDPKVTGFNVGANDGASAGQTVFHLHIHLIPRRDGDVVEPKGGIRGAIPDRQAY